MPLEMLKRPPNVADGLVKSPTVAARVSVLVLFIKKVSVEAVLMLLIVSAPAPESNVTVAAPVVLIETSLPVAGAVPPQLEPVDQLPLPLAVQLLVVMLAPIAVTM
jgi:hypothetical protein